MTRHALLALGLVLASLLAPPWASAQAQTLDENINNRGLPRNAPALSLSSIYGLNPCATGVSVGVTTPLFGIGGATANIDRECETRNNAALAISALHDEKLAREIMCTIADVREAALRLHEPCLRDGGTVPAAATGPSQVPVGEAVPPPAQARVPARYAPAMPMRVPPRAPGMAVDSTDVPAFCRMPGLDLRLYPECAPGSAASQAAFREEELGRPAASQAARRARVAFRQP